MNSVEAYKVSVDYGRSLQKLMSVDRYDMPKTFDVVSMLKEAKEEEKIVEIRLIYFTAPILTNMALAEINKLGLRPGNFFELLSASKINSEVIESYPIISLGSTFISKKGLEFAACLDSRISKNRIYFAPVYGKWLKCCRFLAVKN